MMIIFLQINDIGNLFKFSGDLFSKGIADGIILTLINHQKMTKKKLLQSSELDLDDGRKSGEVQVQRNHLLFHMASMELRSRRGI
jgi:hypothetical protein